MAADTAPPVTDQQLRDAGYTSAARAYPMSEAAVRWLASWNGIPFDKVPAAWWYAPNEPCRRNCEAKAAIATTADYATAGHFQEPSAHARAKPEPPHD